jgi:hypothetical protein
MVAIVSSEDNVQIRITEGYILEVLFTWKGLLKGQPHRILHYHRVYKIESVLMTA